MSAEFVEAIGVHTLDPTRLARTQSGGNWYLPRPAWLPRQGCSTATWRVARRTPRIAGADDAAPVRRGTSGPYCRLTASATICVTLSSFIEKLSSLTSSSVRSPVGRSGPQVMPSVF